MALIVIYQFDDFLAWGHLLFGVVYLITRLTCSLDLVLSDMLDLLSILSTHRTVSNESELISLCSTDTLGIRPSVWILGFETRILCG